MPEALESKAYALMGDWIVHGALTGGDLLETKKFEVNHVDTQSYIWDALDALHKAGVFFKEPQKNGEVFYPIISSDTLLGHLKNKIINRDSFIEMFCSFTACGDLYGFITEDPSEGFLADEKSTPIFDALTKIKMCHKTEELFHWPEHVRPHLNKNYLWPQEASSFDIQDMRTTISDKAFKVLDKLSKKHASEKNTVQATKVNYLKTYFLSKHARLLPKSDHGILTRLRRDPSIPRHYLPDIKELSQFHFTSWGCSKDNFKYFGYDTSMSLLKSQALLVLKKDMGKNFDPLYAKKLLEELYPNPWGIVKEIRKWIF